MKDLRENIEYCSPPVRHGIQWLEKYLGKILSEKKDRNKEGLTECIEGFYALHKVNHPLVKEFMKASKSWDFWDSSYLFEDPSSFYFLAKIGLDKNRYFKETFQHFVKDLQTVSGCITSVDRHMGSMRALVLIEPSSPYTRRAIQFFVQNLKDFDKKT